MREFTIVCETPVLLCSYAEPQRFVIDHYGIIRCDGEPIGRFLFHRVLLGLARNYGQDGRAVCDAYSQELANIYDAIHDARTGEIRDEVDRKFDCLGSDLLVIDGFYIISRWRGLKLGLLTLRKMFDTFQGDCALIVCRPRSFGRPKTQVSPDEGTVKMRRYIKNLGFRRIGRTPYYGLSTSRLVPKFEDLLHGGKARANSSG